MSRRGQISETRRQQILDAAVRVIGERGLCDTRIADIARVAGTSSALVVYYFESKERLLAEALAHSEQRFYAETARELESIPSASGQLVRLIELCCAKDAPDEAWIEEWVLWLDLWTKAYRTPEVARDRERLDRRWRDTIADIVRRGQGDGEFGEIDPDEFALRLAALIDGLAIQVVLRDPDVSARRMRDTCVRMAAGELGFDPAKTRRRLQAARPAGGRARAASGGRRAGG